MTSLLDVDGAAAAAGERGTSRVSTPEFPCKTISKLVNELDTFGNHGLGLTSWDTPPDIHCGDLGPTPGGRSLIDITLLGLFSYWAPSVFGFKGVLSAALRTLSGGLVVNDDSDATAFGSGAELDIRTLGQGNLREFQCPVKACEITLRHLGCFVFTRSDLLCDTLESGNLLSLR